ncbi:hypothetical protein CN172_02840 [Sinorhizobium meliloti]|nr:hypothetical protein CDO28_25475 [Sinorhizobium meliloti]RVE97416.1 hypothetical protein CN232_22440 [Sinorhizobium meliloti]RVH42318.1 hypothetical protein CN208_18940 [Sinorhizobium meliloti]RVI70512.1 hypothetical protein CN189_00500 [Sinorhizobium meliloti]RVI74786.1 hypothetical protein CN190_31625 [Sinorhizobium meliloti]
MSSRPCDNRFQHSDEAITERVKAHKEIKDNIRERRRMVSTLRRAGLPGPGPFAGDVTKALADAGLHETDVSNRPGIEVPLQLLDRQVENR